MRVLALFTLFTAALGMATPKASDLERRYDLADNGFGYAGVYMPPYTSGKTVKESYSGGMVVPEFHATAGPGPWTTNLYLSVSSGTWIYGVNYAGTQAYIHAGVRATVDTSGKLVTTFFYTTLWYITVNDVVVNEITVSPGDSVNFTINRNGDTVSITYENLTTGKSYTVNPGSALNYNVQTWVQWLLYIGTPTTYIAGFNDFNVTNCQVHHPTKVQDLSTCTAYYDYDGYTYVAAAQILDDTTFEMKFNGYEAQAYA